MWKSIRDFALAAAFLAATAAASAQEAQLIVVLKSDAAQKEKADACRQLARVATKQSVPALAALLGDEKLSHMARYALETIPDPSVDDALRDALGKLKGRPLMGVIGSLGVRRDAKAVDAIAKLLADPDAELAQAAARALGQIGTIEAAKALRRELHHLFVESLFETGTPETAKALSTANAAKQAAVCEGLFRSAEALAAQGQGAESLAIYDHLRRLGQTSSPQFHLPQPPQQVRAGALRGAILVRGKEGIPLMLEAIRGADYVLTAAAARAAIELPGPEVTAALAGELPKLPAEKQVLVINTLGYRGDASAGPALLPLAAKGPDAVRLAAIHNLTHLNYFPAMTLLAEMSLGDSADLAAAARTCLGGFTAVGADGFSLELLGEKSAKARRLGVEMIGQRNFAGSAAALLKAAADEDETVRIAALNVLRDQAGLPELPALLQILVKARSPAQSQATERALGALCARQSQPAAGKVVIVKAEYGDLPDGPLADVTRKVSALVKAGALSIDASNDNFGDPANGRPKNLRVDYRAGGVAASKTVHEGETLTFTATETPPAIVDAISTAMGEARGEAKLALLRALRSAGGPKALQTVAAAAADSDPQVKETALRALCDWPTSDALPLVAEMVKAPPTKTIKVLALRGFVRLVPQQDAPDAKKLDSLKDAMALAERDEEKRLVLSALGEVPTAEALALVMSHLDNPGLKEEACLAAVAIGEKIAASHRAEATAAMKQVAKTTANKKLAARANVIARQGKK
jgi:HEAT repeat protein